MRASTPDQQQSIAIKFPQNVLRGQQVLKIRCNIYERGKTGPTII